MEKNLEPKNIKSLEEYNSQKNIDQDFDIKKIYESLLRRKKIILLTASLVFTLGVINTINQRIRNPIFRGNFSLLISDPITTKNSILFSSLL